MSLVRSTVKTLLLTQSLNKLPTVVNTRFVKRWVAPTLRELRKRSRKLGPQEPQKRAGFIEWNYRSELFAYGKRLNEEFQLPILQTAFTSRCYVLQEEKRQRDLGVEQTDIEMVDNRELSTLGAQLASDYVKAYIEHSLPKLPTMGQKALADYLLSEETLAHVGMHLGIKDLILSADYPPNQECLASTLLAIIGALEKSSGVQRAFHFVRDFICTQLNQRDLLDLWHIENPEKLLQQICQERQISEPEPRLIGESAKNSVLAVYHVGIYSNKQMIGKGFGEDVSTAVQTASLDALQAIFGIHDNMTPFNFKMQVEPKLQKLEN